MAGPNIFLLSSLPPLGDMGSVPPLDPRALAAYVSEFGGPRALVDVLLMADDLVQREAYLAGEVKEVAPAVLSPEQVRNEAPLPDDLVSEEAEAPRRIAADATWEAYYRHAARVAGGREGAFLPAWLRFEVSLCNALATARARALNLDPAPYLVAAGLDPAPDDFAPLLAEWASAPNPLLGLQVLDRARWHWLVEHDGWFTFADDEVAAYAAKLMLLVRWHRMKCVADETPATGAASSASHSVGRNPP